ncbi:MAG: DUF1553 domain-containing protein [Planctomycetales bacterium]|nr:DUF1553 domain-containing protein [Planctomycetales bacterium]
MVMTYLPHSIAKTWFVASLSLAIFLAAHSLTLAQSVGKLASDITFAREVAPILTKAGCNSGACHGAAAGRGYLALSLFGSRPAQDYQNLVHGLHGRFLDVQDPEQSLLLKKPSGRLDHGGDLRLPDSEVGYHVIRNWIEQQAPRGEIVVPKSLLVHPLDSTDLQPGSAVRVSIEAIWSDGQRTATLPWLIVDGAKEATDDSVTNDQSTVNDVNVDSLEVTPPLPAVTFRRVDQQLVFQAHQVGYLPITFRFGPVATTMQLWCSSATAPFAMSKSTSTLDQLASAQILSSGFASSATTTSSRLARRLWLDLMGKHPSLEQWEEDTHWIETGKLPSVVDRMLASSEFNAQAAHIVSSWVTQASRTQVSGELLIQPIAERLSRSDDLLQLAIDMLAVADNDSHHDLSLFHRFATDARTRVELIAACWMGVRLGCAQCHDHPLDVWQQDDYFSMAACWAEIDVSDNLIRRIEGRTTTDLRTGRDARPAVPTFPLSTSISEHPDQAFVSWLCHPENPYFTPNLANRVWTWLMGAGLVEEVDDQRATNPPVNPALLKHLSDQLRNSDYSLRSLVREIVLSDAYARDTAEDAPRLAIRLAASRRPKDIPIQVSLMANQAFSDHSFAREIDRDRQSSDMMMSPIIESCTRAVVCSDPMSQGLELVAGKELNQLISTLVRHLYETKLINVDSETEQNTIVAEELTLRYRQIFGFQPSRDDLAWWHRQLAEKPELSDRLSFAEDLIWSWLISPQFRQLY